MHEVTISQQVTSCSANPLLPTAQAPGSMPQTPLPMASVASSNFQTIFVTALKRYREKTKNDLITHPLTAQLQLCESPTAVLDVLNKQYGVQEFLQSQSDDARSRKRLGATVTVLCAFSAAVGEGAGLVNLRFINNMPSDPPFRRSSHLQG
jgi:hypothetical protein